MSGFIFYHCGRFSWQTADTCYLHHHQPQKWSNQRHSIPISVIYRYPLILYNFQTFQFAWPFWPSNVIRLFKHISSLLTWTALVKNDPASPKACLRLSIAVNLSIKTMSVNTTVKCHFCVFFEQVVSCTLRIVSNPRLAISFGSFHIEVHILEYLPSQAAFFNFF